jgi:UDP-N-acetylglucosamine 2-epimerase
MHGRITAGPLHALHCADRLLVFGDSQRRELCGLGIADSRIVVCGAPSLDHRPHQTGTIHPQLRSKLGLRPGEPWILVANSGPGHSISHAHHEKVIENLVRLNAALPDVPLVVKLHRKDRMVFYRRGLKDRASARFVVIPNNTPGFPTDIFDWLQGCSLVLTGASSVAIEAMLMDVPVITMDYCDEIHGADFIDAGATVHVHTGEDLESAVGSILVSGGPSGEVRQRMQDYLKDAFLALDRGSAARGASALCELASSGRPE